MEQQHIVATTFTSGEERVELVRFCATTTGRPEVAEDLAQETLLEAWRHEQALHDPARRSQWLLGVARNVCLRWRRKYSRDESHHYQGTSIENEQYGTQIDQLCIDEYDIELNLERKELLELLDRALALLPAETRIVLIKHYIDDFPLAEVATQLGTTPNALAVRLHRGKLALRRLLTQDMQQEFAMHYQLPESTTWEETSLWCYRCGKQRLLGKRVAREGKLLLKCPLCSPDKHQLLSRSELPLLQGMKSYKPMLTKLRHWGHEYYRAALAAYFGDGTTVCDVCRQPLTILLTPKEELPGWLQSDLWDLPWVNEGKLVNTFCSYCQTSCTMSLSGLTLVLPEVHAFAHSHARICTFPAQHLETAGRSALLTRFESVTENAAIIVISDEETYGVLRVEQEGQ